ncbi:WASH complex subunit 2-like isoform X3 [Pleurodeles waltl]|uniref:WASH complex subunit 2-like isoform X3 n=1 Tax=Pleurodeles waltl TaxID=8319 RepID=UPI0037098A8C
MEGPVGATLPRHEEQHSGGGSSERSEAIWERPWTLEEIRSSSGNWSLAADAGLLNFLQEFSQQTISKTHEIEKQLDDLIRDTKTTNCRLHNVFNDFLMLSNTQFIENRVYDEEVAEPIPKPDTGDKQDQEKTREQKEAELIPKVQEAVNYGLQVLESAFEQLDIKAGNSDSEEEEVNERVEPILEPKDLYIDRPLPYIIGSQLFMEQEDVGLGEFSSEEDSIDSDRASGVDSEDEKEEQESDEDSENSSEEQKLQTALSDEDDDDGSNLFDSEKEEEEDTVEDHAKSENRPRPTSFAEELAARIKGDIPNKPNKDSGSPPSVESVHKKQVKEKKEMRKASSGDEDEDDVLFKPPELTNEDFSPFGTQGGLFSGGTGLFDDDEDDLFVEVPRVKKVKEMKTQLNDGGEQAFNPSSICAEKDQTKPLTPKSETAPKLHTGSGLFDDDVDDFFGELKTNPTNSDSDSKLFKEKPDSLPGTKNSTVTLTQGTKETVAKHTFSQPTPEGSKSLLHPSNKTHTKGLFSDEEDTEDLFVPRPKESKQKSASLPASKATKSLSLFDDDEEGNLFTVVPAKSQISVNAPHEKIKANELEKTSSNILFSSDEEDHWERSRPVTEQKQTDNLAKPSFSKEQIGKVEKNTTLFDEEEDLFVITKDSNKRTQRASLLFEDDVSNEGTLFSNKSSSAGPALQIQVKNTYGQMPSSLFDGDKKDAPVKPAEKETSQVKKSGAEKKTDEVVDMFSETDGFAEHIKEKGETSNTRLQNDDSSPVSGPQPLGKENKNITKNIVSLFEVDEEEENFEDQLVQREPQKEVKKPLEKKPHSKSTGVFQDEELLFSDKLQKDNDPDVDLFASSKTNMSEKAGHPQLSFGASLFGDEEDDLFSTAKSKNRPRIPEKKLLVKKDSSETVKEVSKNPKKQHEVKKVDISESVRVEDHFEENSTVPVSHKTKEPASRIGKLQASLSINPTTMLPGAVFKVPGTSPSLPDWSTSSHHHDAAPSNSTSKAKSNNEDVSSSFDQPAKISILRSANKDRIKVTGKRRPPSRAGRRLASQESDECYPSMASNLSHLEETATISDISHPETEEPKENNYKKKLDENVFIVSPSSSLNDFTVKNIMVPEMQQPAAIDDIFSSDGVSEKHAVSKISTGSKAKGKSIEEAVKKPVKAEKKSALVFDDQESDEDLFHSAKQSSSKKTKLSPFLDNEGEEDLFGVVGDKKSVKKTGEKIASQQGVKQKKQRIFEDDIFSSEAIKPAKKLKEKEEAKGSDIFDNTDIFSDLAVKPKDKKSKKKVDPKSIFDDDMDDIFSSASQVKTSKSKVRPEKSDLKAKTESKASSSFDDPLNVFSGQ